MDDLSSIFDFVRSAIRLRPRLNDMLRWEAMGTEEKALAEEFLHQRSAEESLLYRGMVVSLAGAFEQFIRRILRDSVLAMSGKGTNYDSLSAAMKKENLYRTGLALGTVHEPLDYLDLNYESLAKNLGTCFAGSAQALLNAEAFVIFLSIISPKNLEDALRRINVALRGDDFGRVAEIQTALEQKGTRDTTKAVEANLKRFGQMRNKIAHSGSSGVVVTESDLRSLLQFFRAERLLRSSKPTSQSMSGSRSRPTPRGFSRRGFTLTLPPIPKLGSPPAFASHSCATVVDFQIAALQ